MAETKPTRADITRTTGDTTPRESGPQRRPLGGWLSSPLDVMDRMTDEMERMFDRIYRDFVGPRRSGLTRTPLGSIESHGLWTPRVEAVQRGDRFIVRADLPGLKKEDVQVEVRDDVLTIQGERRSEQQEEREGYYHSEREYGQFYRTIQLPEGVIADNAQATFKNGVLEISMPALPAEATRGRKLEIKEGTTEGR